MLHGINLEKKQKTLNMNIMTKIRWTDQSSSDILVSAIDGIDPTQN